MFPEVVNGSPDIQATLRVCTLVPRHHHVLGQLVQRFSLDIGHASMYKGREASWLEFTPFQTYIPADSLVRNSFYIPFFGSRDCYYIPQ